VIDTAPEIDTAFEAAWAAAQSGASRLGARLDAPVRQKNGEFSATASWTTGKEPKHLTVRAKTPEAALVALTEQLPQPLALTAHCPTCNCSPEVLAQ
jgi:hypothetical protein